MQGILSQPRKPTKLKKKRWWFISPHLIRFTPVYGNLFSNFVWATIHFIYPVDSWGGQKNI